MIRVPGSGRFELRLMDGATNPYLLQAGILAAGIDGIEKNRNPGKPLFVNMYEEGDKLSNVKKLPNSLDQALTNLDQNKVLKSAFGDKTINSYIKLKKLEINKFKSSNSSQSNSTISDWEKINTLDC
tara:strand:- start:166 stop:546 length:381 start_codon:yes stop_codon:yes gene_type:complete